MGKSHFPSDLLDKVIISVQYTKVNLKKYNEFIWGSGGCAAPALACKEVVPMSTYEELTLIVNVALLIVAIMNMIHKK